MMLGARVLLEFGWQLETAVERLRHESPRLSGLGKKGGKRGKNPPSQQGNDSSGSPHVCDTGKQFFLESVP